MNLLTKQREIHRLRERTYGCWCWGRWEGWGEEDGNVDLLYLKRITNKDLLCSAGNSAQCYVAAWMRGEFGGEWIRAYVWISPFLVHLKLSQHC